MADVAGRHDSIGEVICRLQRGFTLLELIVVVALMGLLLVVSVPAMRNTLLDDPLQSSGRKMIGYITGVRSKAVREQVSYLLYVDLDENRLWHVKESEEKQGEQEVPEEGVLKLPEDVNLRDIWSRSGGTSGRGIREVWISRQGYLDETVLHIEDDGGESLSLLLAPFLPGVEIREGYYEVE